MIPSYNKKAPAPLQVKLKAEHEPLPANTVGSPQRPMSARDAIRRFDRGKKLHPDTWVSPGVNWAKRLRMNPSAVPLFNERDRPREDDAYTQVRRMMSDVLRDELELKKKREQEGSELDEKSKSPKSPKKHEPKFGTFSNLDTGDKGRRKIQESSAMVERRMMEQARKLEHLFQSMTSQGELMTSAEWSSLLTVIKKVFVPMIQKRIYDLEEILLDMTSDAKVEIKEKGWGIRDVKSYEVEIAKRRATLAGLKVVQDGLLRRQVELKSTQRMQSISAKFVRNKFLMAGMKAANTAKMFKLMGKDYSAPNTHLREETGKVDGESNLLITDRLLQKLKDGTDSDRMQSLEQLAIMGDDIKAVFTEPFARDVILKLIFTPNIRIRNGAKIFVPKMFHRCPVLPVPERKPGVNEETEIKREYERRKSDRTFLHILWKEMIIQSVEIRQSTFQVLSDVIWAEDLEFMQMLMEQLDDGDSQIRVEVIRTLSRLTEGRGNMDVFNRICRMFNDSDWTVRTAVSYALPNVAGLHGAELQAEKDRERAYNEQKQQHDRLRELAEDNNSGSGPQSAPLAAARVRRGSLSNYGRRRGSITTEMLEEKIRRRKQSDESQQEPAGESSPAPKGKHIRFKDVESRKAHSLRHLDAPPDAEAGRTPSEGHEGRKKLVAGIHKVHGQVHTARSMRDKTLSMLEALTEDGSWNVRRSAVQMLAKIASCGNRSAINVVLERAEDENDNVRITAFQCLPKIVTLRDVESHRVMAILLGYLDPLRHVKILVEGVARWPQTARTKFRKLATQALVTIAGRGHIHVVEGLTDFAVHSKDPEVRRAALEMMPVACLVGAENHQTAINACVFCIAEKSDQVRQMAAQVLPQIIDAKAATEMQSALVNLLSHEESAVRRTVVAVIVSIAPAGDRSRVHMREQLQMIAFSSADNGDGASYDDQSLLDPLLGVEEELLQKFRGPDVVAQGLVWKLNSGATGMDASHWRRRLFMMYASRKLTYISMKDGHSGKAITILDESTMFSVTRVHFGSLVPFAVKIEFEEHGTAERKDLVFGFFSKEELVVWVRDLAHVNRLNRQQRNERKREREERERMEAERLRAKEGLATVGRTARMLEDLQVEVQREEAEERAAKTGPSADQVALKERLERLYTDKVLFSEYAGAGRGGSGDHSPLRGSKAEHGKGAGAKLERLEMSNFMKLLRSQNIVGPRGGVTGKMVITAWRIANGLGAAGAKMGALAAGGGGDNDRLLLDWDEYQECLLLLGERAGVPLSCGRKPVVKPQAEPTLRVRKEAIDAMTRHWNDQKLFYQFALTQRERDMEATMHAVPGQHIATMDYREFLALMTHLKLHPDPFSKTVLGRIYKQANAADEGIDAFEFTFDEYKNAMMMLAMEFEIPVYYNGRNIAQHSAFG